MNLQEITDKYKELYNAAKTIKEEQKALIKPMFQAIFDTYPDIKHIRIQAFTPSFNDGDPCRHVTRDPIINPESDEDDEGEYEDHWFPVLNILYEFESIFESTYDTNWELNVKRTDDGSFVIKKREMVL